MDRVDVPYEVRKRIGTILSEEGLLQWWNKPAAVLAEKAPSEIWDDAQGREQVLDYIETCYTSGS